MSFVIRISRSHRSLACLEWFSDLVPLHVQILKVTYHIIILYELIFIIPEGDKKYVQSLQYFMLEMVLNRKIY